jgi:hypothetical protein
LWYSIDMARLTIILLLLGISLVAYQTPPTGDEHKQAHDATQSEHSEATKPQIAQPPFVQQAVNPPKTEQKKQNDTSQHAEQSHDLIDVLNASSTAIIALFTILLFCAVVRQIRTNKQSERAWVAVKRIGNPPEKWIAEMDKGYVPGIVFEFEVHGKTVARVTESRFALAIVPVRRDTLEPDLPLPPDYSAADSYDIAGENRVVVPPDGTFQMRSYLRPFPPTDKQLTDLRNRNVVMCSYGYVKYLDAFGKSRETRVCYVYDMIWGGVITSPDGVVLNPSGFRPAKVPKYNDAT